MKKLYKLLSILGSLAFGAMNPKSDSALYAEYGQSPHFASVGMVEVTSADGSLSDLSTGTLVLANGSASESRYILTAAHSFDGVPELGRERMLFHLNGVEYKIIEYLCHPEFRKGGPDLAVAILDKAVGAQLATVGCIANDDLYKRIWEGLPGIAEAQQGIEHKTHEFSTAGFGRYGTWDSDPWSFTRDNKKRGFVLSWGSVGQSVSDQFPIPETIFRFGVCARNPLSAGSTVGFSGAPVFIRNKTVADAKWRIIGVMKSGDKSAGGWCSLVTPINSSEWLDAILRQGN